MLPLQILQTGLVFALNVKFVGGGRKSFFMTLSDGATRSRSQIEEFAEGCRPHAIFRRIRLIDDALDFRKEFIGEALG